MKKLNKYKILILSLLAFLLACGPDVLEETKTDKEIKLIDKKTKLENNDIKEKDKSITPHKESTNDSKFDEIFIYINNLDKKFQTMIQDKLKQKGIAYKEVFDIDNIPTTKNGAVIIFVMAITERYLTLMSDKLKNSIQSMPSEIQKNIVLMQRDTVTNIIDTTSPKELKNPNVYILNFNDAGVTTTNTNYSKENSFEKLIENLKKRQAR